ncbi:MAG TPA: hypothetical protein VF424_01285, partial [Vicinamibacterales bacterium]
IACAVPYLALKMIWLAGGQLGVADPILTTDPTMIALNVVTAFMDVTAILVALAFTYQWGLRIPAWLLLPPIWIAAGLLSRFVVLVPVVAMSFVLASDSARVPPGGPVEPWVYAVVYPGFTGMGIGLLIAFALYVKTRWASVFEARGQPARSRTTHAAIGALCGAGALMAAAGTALPLAWALGSTTGVRPDLAAGRTLSSYVLHATDAAMGIGAAAGVVMMVYGPGRRTPRWIAVIVTWIGSGSLFAWGLWHLANVLGNTALVRDRVQDMTFVTLTSAARSLAGLMIGCLLLFLLAERQHEPEAADRR